MIGPLFFLAFNICGQELFQREVYYDPDSTNLKEVVHFKKSDSTLHGTYESFHTNGSLQTFGYYKEGVPDSTWVYYYFNGRKRAEGTFRNGDSDGRWSYYYENGSKKSEGILRKSIKHGTWTFYFENGKKKSSGTYISDKKSGIWNYFYEDEILKAQAYYENGTGIYKEFYPSGGVKMEGANKNEKSQGEWQYYFESGELQAKGSFESGLRIGEWVYYHKNGKKAAVGKFTEGKEDGVWKHFFEDGTVSAEGAMESGERDGFWKLYYPTGDLKGEGDYELGNGDYVEYYPSGKQKTSGRIRHGKKHGKWVFYSEEGLVDGEAEFRNGEGTYTGFYPDGSVKMSGKMKDDKRVGEWQLYDQDGTLAGTYKPIYEDESPIFKTRESIEDRDPVGSDKPEYLFKRRQLRYFTPIINEYDGVILGINPFAISLGHFPIALEFYQQERLGYELQFTFHRDPFFEKDSDIPQNEVYQRGGTVEFKQKFYHQDRQYGMWYFGHQLGFSSIQHSVKVLDQSFEQDLGQVSESRYYYGIILGTRWMQRFADSGFTVDLYVGVGAGVRDFDKNYEPNTTFDDEFSDVLKSKGYFPVLIGMNFGIVGPKRRLTK